MTLQLLICTFNDGIKRIPDLLLPPIDGVEYLVSWQQADDFTPHELPEEIADRSDVEVTTLPGRFEPKPQQLLPSCLSRHLPHLR